MQDNAVMVLCNSNDCRVNCDLSVLSPAKQRWGLGAGKPPGINPTFTFCCVTGLAPSKYGSTNLFTYVRTIGQEKLSQRNLFIYMSTSICKINIRA